MSRTWKSESHNTFRHAPGWFKRLNRRLRRRRINEALRNGLRRKDASGLVLPRFRKEDEWLWW